MKLADFQIRLPSSDPVPFELPALNAWNGTVWVEMDPHEHTSGSLLLADNDAEMLRPQSGTVLASGQPWCCPGDRVLVSRQIGLWLSDVTIGRWGAEGQVRVYGVGTRSDPEGSYYDPSAGIYAIMGEELTPIKNWVLVKRDSAEEESAGGILLSLGERYRGMKATVVASGEGRVYDDGSRQEMPKPGTRVAYNVLAPKGEILNLEERYPSLLDRWGGKSDDYALIDVLELLAELPSEHDEMCKDHAG